MVRFDTTIRKRNRLGSAPHGATLTTNPEAILMLFLADHQILLSSGLVGSQVLANGRRGPFEKQEARSFRPRTQ